MLHITVSAFDTSMDLCLFKSFSRLIANIYHACFGISMYFIWYNLETVCNDIYLLTMPRTPHLYFLFCLNSWFMTQYYFITNANYLTIKFLSFNVWSIKHMLPLPVENLFVIVLLFRRYTIVNKYKMKVPVLLFAESALTHFGRDKMASISQTMFSNAFSWMKMCEFCLRLQWNLFPRVQSSIFHHLIRQWLGADQATNHYMNHWWLVYWPIYASLGLNELKERLDMTMPSY